MNIVNSLDMVIYLCSLFQMHTLTKNLTDFNTHLSLPEKSHWFSNLTWQCVDLCNDEKLHFQFLHNPLTFFFYG